ncbi:purple acid phosphatase family protein [Zavarzinella formosa]|uniref:purple acid phosphatase family protein n=1 Tax=Zavarzinella formosa TaxID=360055 RepID=UPI00031B54D3|nr:metallophosphoesterase family protein [Zavarzinella formosa]
MFHLSRRGFIGASLAGVASGQFVGPESPANAISPAPVDSASLSTLFLTWQSDPTTTMTIQWVGNLSQPADTTVYYWPANIDPLFTFRQPQPTRGKPYPKANHQVFRAELTGLTPDTEYCFTVGRQGKKIYRFRTMPLRANDTISFISGGDCGANPHTIANNIQAARQDPMFAVIGGDLAYENGTSADTHLAFLRNYSQHMVGKDGRLIPMIACLGNHEVDGGYGQPRSKAKFFYSLFDGLFPERGFATLDFGDYLSLVLLDTGHTTPIEGEQTAWLERILRDRADHPNVFAVNHVPAYPSFRSPEGKGGTGVGNREHWVPLFERHRVPVVLEHHDHTFKRTKPLLDGMGNNNGVLYLGDGSWGQVRAPQKPEKLSVMAKTSGEYHLSLHRIQGEERFHMALDERGRVMDVCRSGQRKAGLVPTAS